MSIVYVLPSASLCGGVKVIAEHVTGLIAAGHPAEVWGLSGNFNWFPRPVPHRLFRSTNALGEALREHPGPKVATFWVTASWVASTLQPGQRGFYLIQDEDELTYGGSTAGTSYKLGLTHITESAFVTDEITRKYGTPCHNVGIGIDLEIYHEQPIKRERYRVFMPARTTSAGPGSLKGLDRQIDVLKRLSIIEPRASVVTFGLEASPVIDFMPHIHVHAPSDAKLRELYSQAGVFLTCSRHEGFGLPQLEAMACGCPTAAMDAHGNREYAIGNSAFSDDPNLLANDISRLMNDNEYFEDLRGRGLRVSQGYRWGKVIDNLIQLYSFPHEV